jgi:hypothetical protein
VENLFEDNANIKNGILPEYKLITDRPDFFQRIQTWPINDELNYKGWLTNFSTPEEKKLASHILDFFMFYPRNMVNQMLKTAIGYCGKILVSHFSNWQHDDFLRKCIYSFIPGETNNPTDSGHIYARKLRNELHIPQENIIYFNDLYSLLEKSSSTSIPVIFVDDFVGSGAQCDKAWNENRGGKNNCTLSEIASTSDHIFIYAPLIANYKGFERINSKCKGLILTTCHILNYEYNLFKPQCICWKNENRLYTKGVELILSKSKEQGIPSNEGNNEVDIEGFDRQGLAIAFEDSGAPDAIPAFFYWCSSTWTPLVKKEYKR